MKTISTAPVQTLGPGAHGGNIIATARQLGVSVADLADMSSNLTPLGMVPGLREIIMDRLHEISYLPETGSETLCDIFAAKYGVRSSQVQAGNGTTEFIYAIPAAVGCKRGVIVNPTYGDYHLACEWSGMVVDELNLRPEQGFALDLDELSRKLRGDELVFICNPNNPTGGLTPSATLHDFVRHHPKSVFLVDESYLPFVREPSLLAFPLPENLFVLGSSSKVYGIPGLRLGFLVASEPNMARISRQRKPWGVNRVAQIAGEFLLQHADSYVEEVVRFVEEKRPPFVKNLAALPGVSVVEGVVNFILCRLEGAVTAVHLRERMLEKRIMIRNCANFASLDASYFRLSLKDDQTNQRCFKALREILEEGQ